MTTTTPPNGEGATKTIEDLRTRLFDAIDKVSRGEMSLDQARQISDLSQVIVNTAKVEVDYLRVTGNGESPFIDRGQDDARRKALPNGITGVVTHRLRG